MCKKWKEAEKEGLVSWIVGHRNTGSDSSGHSWSAGWHLKDRIDESKYEDERDLFVAKALMSMKLPIRYCPFCSSELRTKDGCTSEGGGCNDNRN